MHVIPHGPIMSSHSVLVYTPSFASDPTIVIVVFFAVHTFVHPVLQSLPGVSFVIETSAMLQVSCDP